MATFVTHDMVPAGGGGGSAMTGETVVAATTSGSPHAITKQKTISIPTAAAAVFFQLPAPASAIAYVDYEIKDGKFDAATNHIKITAASGLIDGQSSRLLITNRCSIKFFTDGTNWFIA